MITDALISVVGGLMGWLIGLLPSWSFTLPDGVVGVLSTLAYFDDILPIHESLACIALIGTFTTAMYTFKLAKQIIDWIAAVIP